MSGVGHIGELQIIDVLEKQHNFHIYLPMKDKGLDFIAQKENLSIQVQVKTSTFQKERYYWFDIDNNKMIYSSNTFYIFVCYVLPRRKMMGKNRNFLIVPSLDLKEMISNKLIESKKNAPNIFNIFIYPDEKENKWIYKNKGKELDFSKYLNNFNFLKK